VGPVLNNGNDGNRGWDGSANYYQRVAAAGYIAAGGESERDDRDGEDQAIMASLPFMNYGGEGTGGRGCGNNDIFTGGNICRGVKGYGCASYLESYTSNSMISADCMADAAVVCKQAGCKEVGIMIGPWAGQDYGAGAGTYAAMVNAYEAKGVTCAGFVVWNGHGTDANSNHNQVAGIIQTLQQTWPPDTRPLNVRFAGGPTPPGPGPTPPPTPPQPGPENAKQFTGFTDIDILNYMAKKHDNQPTPGAHSVIVYLPTTGQRGTLNVAVRTREHQPGIE
jgi:hypothetical protein